jgi:hypothetical protein
MDDHHFGYKQKFLRKKKKNLVKINKPRAETHPAKAQGK